MIVTGIVTKHMKYFILMVRNPNCFNSCKFDFWFHHL